MARTTNVVTEKVIFVGDAKSLTKATKDISKGAGTADQSISKLGKSFRTIAVSGIGRGFGDLKQALGAFSRGNLSYGVSFLSRSIDGLNAAGRGAAAGLAMAVAAVSGLIAIGVKGINTYAQLGLTISKIGFTTGIGPEAATNLWAQFKMTGIDTQTGARAIAMFTKNLWAARTGTGNQAKALKELGISLKDANGNWKDASTLLPEVRKALSETTDKTLKAGAAMALFGRGWQSLGRWISTSEKDIQSYNDIVKKSGFTFDEAGYNKFITAQRKVSLVWQLMWAQIGKLMSGPMAAIAGWVSTWGVRIMSFFERWYKEIGIVVAALGTMMVITKVTVAMQAFAAAINVLTAGGAARTITNIAQAIEGAQMAASLGPTQQFLGTLGTATVGPELSGVWAAATTTGIVGGTEAGIAESGTLITESVASSMAAGVVSGIPGGTEAAMAEAAPIITESVAAAMAAGVTEGMAAGAAASGGGAAAAEGAGAIAGAGWAGSFLKGASVSFKWGLPMLIGAYFGSKSVGDYMKSHGSTDVMKQLQYAHEGTSISAEAKKQADALQSIVDKIRNLKPGAGAANTLHDLWEQLAKLYDTAANPELKAAIGKVMDQVKKMAPDFKAASKAAADLDASIAAISDNLINIKEPSGALATMTKAQAAAFGWYDLKNDVVAGGAELVDSVQQSAAATAAAGADLTNTLAKIPKNIVQILNRDWPAVGAATNKAMLGINEGFSNMSTDMITAWSTRIAGIAGIAGSLGTVLKTLADAPKKVIAPTQQNWTALGQALFRALEQILAVFAKVSDELLGKNAKRMTSIASVAGSLGTFINAIKDMPTKAVAPARQAWGALAAVLDKAMKDILAVFAGDKSLGAEAKRAGSIGTAAGGIGSFISAIADMPAKAIKWVPQRFHALGVALQSAMNDILSVFSGTGTKQLATEATRAGSIGSISSAIAGMFTSFADITESSAQQALDGVKAARSKAKDMAAQIVGLVSDFQKAMKPLKVSEAGATKFGRVQTITSGVATIIGDFADMTAASIDKAVAAMQYVAEKKAPLIAGAMHDVVVALQAQFLKMDLGKNFADTTDRITTIVSNIAGLLGTFADMTAASIDKAVDVMKYIAEQKAPDIGAAMKDMIVGIAKGIGDYSVDDALVTVTEKITGIAQNIASTLTQFGTLTKAGIDTAITNMRYAAQNANVLAGAMVDMAKALKSAFDDAGVDAAYADATDAIGRVMDTLSKVMDFASGMTEDMIGKIKTFVQLAPANEDLWTQVGSVLARMITLVTDALGIIPDTTALTQAEAAISTLTSIFDAMTGLTDSISKAAAWVSPTTTDTTSANYTPTPVAAMAASGNSTNVNVNVSWSTLTGEPSAREKRQLVASLKPELDRVNAAKTRTGF